jgi:hypothetical protein
MSNLVPDYNHWHICPKCKHQTPLFVKEWVGLTDEDLKQLRHLVDWTVPINIQTIAIAVEAKLKDKNT